MHRRILFALMFALMLAGCGQKGDLYLPPDEAANGDPQDEQD